MKISFQQVQDKMRVAKGHSSRKRSSRREILKYGIYGSLTAGLWSSLWASGCGGKGREKKRPNVILVVLDTARADRFSFMGYGHNTSPHIDALTSEATVYSRAYAPAFWTLPSHASLFTGLYSSQAGATSVTNYLPGHNTTLAEILKEAGYRTAGFSCNAWISKERGFSQGFNEFEEMWRPSNHSHVRQRRGRQERAALEQVLAWLVQSREVKNPFFIFINFNSPHLPYDPPYPFQANFISADYHDEELSRLAKVNGMWAYLCGELKLSERDLRIMGDLYDGEIAFTDYCVGRVVEQLRDLGLINETLIIVTSDHGENLGEHGLIDHLLSMYETTLHVPLLIRYPENFKAGDRVNDLVSLLDILPTILDFCNIRGEIAMPNPQTASLARQDRSKRKFIVAENERPMNGIRLVRSKFPAFDTTMIEHPMRAIRTERHKYIWRGGGSAELYDLKADPGELHNLIDEQPDIRSKLHGMLAKWTEEKPVTGDLSPFEGKDVENLKVLRSLGYLE